MTYIDPTTTTDPTTSSASVTNAVGSYTGVPQHVIIDGKDFLIVDADSNGVAIFSINPVTGALITPPTQLTWPQVAGENETGDFDKYQFYTSPDGTKAIGFESDNTGVTALSYDIPSGTWSVAYDQDTAAGGITKDFAAFDTFQASDGKVYGYGSLSTDQNFTKYEWNWTTQSWTEISTVTGATLGSISAVDNNTDMEMVSGADGSQYMVNFSNNGGLRYTNIYKIDSATGDIIPNTNVRIDSSTTSTGPTVLRDFMGGEISIDPFGHMVFSTENGIQVIDPATGAFLFNDNPGGADGSSFYYGSDLIYADDGYIYLVGRNGNGSLDTKVYQIDGSGNWQFVTQGVDTTSTITWSGISTGTYTESSNDVTTLSSGLKMIYTTQEAGANGPTTLVAAQPATIGESSFTASVCFVAGTLIKTSTGPKPVERLEVGDLVYTKDNGFKPILWIGINTFSLDGSLGPEYYPIRIKANALGVGYPQTDLYVSQQHRVLVKSKIVEKVVGCDEALVAAKKLLEFEGIEIVTDCDEVTYVHFLFDQHEVVYANGAETESLYTGPEALKAIEAASRAEIIRLFPELIDMNYEVLPARPLAYGKISKKLVMRHAKNNVALYSIN